MPPKAARGATRGRGRGRGRGRATASEAEIPLQEPSQSASTVKGEESQSIIADADIPLNATPLQNDSQPSPNSSPVTQPTETPAPTPVRAPLPRSDSANVSNRGGAAGSSGRGDSAAASKSKFKPRNIRRDHEARQKLEAAERERLRERTEAEEKAARRARGFIGRSRGTTMGARGGIGRGGSSGTAHGLFGITPAYGTLLHAIAFLLLILPSQRKH